MLSGIFNIAMGEKFDPKKGEAVRPGGFFTAEKDMQRYGWTTRPAVIQIHGMGPFAINYVNPNRPIREWRRPFSPMRRVWLRSQRWTVALVRGKTP